MDDSFIFDEIDNLLLNIDMDTLKQAKENMIRNNEDTSVIDKAISEKLRLEKLDKEDEKKYKELCRDAALLGLLSGLIPNSIDKVKICNNYEPYQFEEEELEDDDYYNEDID